MTTRPEIIRGWAARITMTLAVMMIATTSAKAEDTWPEYISDVMLIGGSQSTTNSLKTRYQNQGWTVVDYDLNKGCGGSSDFIFLLYKKASRNSTDRGYITDFYVTYHDKSYNVANLSTTVNYNYKDYTLCTYVGDYDFVNNKGDLNSNASGKYIHLYYTKANFTDKRAVTDITFNTSNDYALVWNGVGDDDGKPADLNKGCGSSSPYIYMHLTTATKTNRPTTDPVLEKNWVYNGEAKPLVKTAATIAIGTMYYRLGASGIFTTTPSSLTAKDAGTYTVYYYADENQYGNQSDTHSQTVKITESPNDGATVVVDPCYGSDMTVSPSISGTNLSTGTVTYQYATAENGTYTSTVPTTPGTYWVRATIAGDNNCESYTTAPMKFMKVAWKGSGTAASPLLISSTTDLDLLATEVNGGNNFQGVVFKLNNDIAYTYTSAWNDVSNQENNFTAIGNINYPFCGTFDGGGYTISGIRVSSNIIKYLGIFGYISNGAVVEGVTLADTHLSLSASNTYLGGIAGKADGNSTITNCHVKDNVELGLGTSVRDQNGGGIVGEVTGTVSHCTSAATLSFPTYYLWFYGGIAGYSKNATLTDNFVLGATLNDRDYIGAITGWNLNSTFARNYYAHCTKGTATTGFGCNGADITDNDGARPVHTLTLDEGISATATPTVTYGGIGYYKQGTIVTLSGGLDGTPPVGYAYDGYSVNGEAIDGNTFNMPNADATVAVVLETLYTLTLADGITVLTPPASSDGVTNYYKAGTTITLSGGLDGANATPGGNPYCYILDDFCLSGNTFTMPAANATVVAAPVPTDWDEQGRDGNSEATAYLICTTEQLDTLAQRVNDGTTDYEGKYFRLMNDLSYAYTTAWDDTTSQETNYTPIGYVSDYIDRLFRGHFLGDGHTVSGIRVYRGGNASIDGNLGLFGRIGEGAEVSGVTVADARITGYAGVGGIVGYSKYGTVTDCHVEADVALHAVQNYARNFGGIVGYNTSVTIEDINYGSTVIGCTSAVMITVKNGLSNLQSFGGIVGRLNGNASITNCRAEGAVLPAVTDAGAIVGYDDNENTTLTDNTYHSCLVGNNAFNIGVGYRMNIGYGDMDGARLDASALRLDDCRDNTALIAAYAAPQNHTAYNGTAPNVGSLAITLHGRTLYKDGTWNTLCLPFNATMTGPLAEAVVKELDTETVYSGHQTGFDAATGTLYLYFKDATSITAGRPYIVKWNNTESTELVNPVFSGVTVDDGAPTVVTSDDGKVTFAGSYAPVALTMRDNLLIGSGNTLSYPGADGTQLNAFRAYLSVPAPIDLPQLKDAVLGMVAPTAASDVNGDKQTDILDITTLIDYLTGNGLVKRVVSNVDLGLGD